ncbi:MAG: peptidylprolyl isomerase [Spirochaetales bacterium]|nr:peptidylprolyl isomerase [Spirochaetales bacterium]
MIRRRVFLTVVFLIVACAFLTADAAQVAATVTLIRSTSISMESLKAKEAEYRAELQALGTGATMASTDVLNIMVNDELVLQGAERDGFLVTESQLNQIIKTQRTSVEQQLNTTITDAQFEQIIMSNYGLDMAAFRKSLRDSATIDAYVRAKYPAILEEYGKPTEAQIQEFFRANRTSFMNPELVRISHIFMPYSETDNAAVLAEMEKIARWIRYGTYTFEELVPKYSKDTASVNKGGDIGWLAYDNTEMREYLGPAFFDAVFALNVGKPSGILESNSGYHIVKVVTHIDPKLLTIQDTITPESNTTVYRYIEQRLLSQNQQQAYVNAINKLVEDLRKQAKIEIFL